MLSLSKYRWLCVLGAEIAYFACLLGDWLPIRTTRICLDQRSKRDSRRSVHVRIRMDLRIVLRVDA
jgi:hypothetical protein